jgi:hypothetical protein
MPPSPLVAGIATGIGSLPHRDPDEASALVLGCIPELPAAPQLPVRSPLEGMVVQGALGVPGVQVGHDGTVRLAPPTAARMPTPSGIDVELDPDAHAGLLAFCHRAARLSTPPARVKAQVVGPLTLGLALEEAGLPTGAAFAAGLDAVRTCARAIERQVARSLPDAALLLFFDEPGLVRWTGGRDPLDPEEATDLLSSALAAPSCTTGVHVCGGGELRIALNAGPRVIGVDVAAFRIDDAVALARFLEDDGWVAWGAVPTDRPVGESAAPLWRALVDLWGELARRACEPTRLRDQALVTPACGLAGHGTSQAERALRLARELGLRVQDQSVASSVIAGA